jgi:hypothetical protein
MPAASSGPAVTCPTAIASTRSFIAATSASRWPSSSATVSRLAAAGALVNVTASTAQAAIEATRRRTGATSSGSTQR